MHWMKGLTTDLGLGDTMNYTLRLLPEAIILLLVFQTEVYKRPQFQILILAIILCCCYARSIVIVLAFKN